MLSCAHTHTHIYVCMYIYIYIYICTYIGEHSHTKRHTPFHAFLCTHTHKHTHICIYMHIDTWTVSYHEAHAIPCFLVNFGGTKPGLPELPVCMHMCTYACVYICKKQDKTSPMKKLSAFICMCAWYNYIHMCTPYIHIQMCVCIYIYIYTYTRLYTWIILLWTFGIMRGMENLWWWHVCIR